MTNFTKSETAKLRDLASEAYERELGLHLSELEKSFAAWRRGKLLSSDLSNELHEFHQRTARDVWKSYQMPHPSSAVARAIAVGTLKVSELPQPLLTKLAEQIEAFKQVKSAV